MAVRLRLEKGDVEGHPFRGNQWTEGQGGSESNNENNAQGRMEFWTQGGKYAEQHARVSTVINNLAGLFGTPPLNVLIAGERGRDTRGWYHHAQNEDKYPTNIHGVPRPGSSVIIAAHPAWIHVGPNTHLETVAHEFAHHLDASRGIINSEPPKSLPEVRTAIAGAENAHNRLERNNSGWQEGARARGFVLATDQRRKGDVEGHPFRGNQWTEGQGGSSEDESANVTRLSKEFEAVKPELDKLITDAISSDEEVVGAASSWDDLSSDKQAEIEEQYIQDNLSGLVDSEIESYLESSDDSFDEQLNENTEWRDDAVNEWLEESGIDPASLDEAEAAAKQDTRQKPLFEDVDITKPEGVELYKGGPVIDPSKLRWSAGGSDRWEGDFSNPGAIIDDLKNDLESSIDTARDKALQQLKEDFSSDPPDWITDSAKESGAEYFSQKDDDEKLDFALTSNLLEDAANKIVQPEEYQPFTDGADYQATRSVVTCIQNKRAEYYWEKRGCDPGMGPGEYSSKTWGAWKGSSTSDIGLALQQAAAEELGGKVRFDPGEEEKAKRGFDKMGGKEAMKAYVRATWEGSQYVLAKSGLDEINTYRAVFLPTHEIEVSGKQTEIQGLDSRHDLWKALPGMAIKRNGVASTTILREKANNWHGVGKKPIEPSERVVLRIKTPREGVVSIPAYGQNVTEEQEVVVAGVKWKAWDVWRDKAPLPDAVAIKAVVDLMVKQSKKQYVIDLNKLDAGQPHWLNGAAQEAVRREEREERRQQHRRRKIDSKKGIKGDVEGHPFRGNQWTEGQGGGESTFDKSSWSSMPISERRSAWDKLSAAERDRLNDAANTIPNRVSELLGDVPPPQDSGSIRADIDVRTDLYRAKLSGTSYDKIHATASQYADTLTRAGASREAVHKLTMLSLDMMAAQEIEGMGRTLGDHGASHIKGNIDTAMAAMAVVPREFDAQDRAVLMTAAVFHDTGYLTPPAQMFLDSGHGRSSAEYYNEHLRDTVTAALGKRAAADVDLVIRTHDAKDIDWDNEPVASAMRLADNTSLFSKEKLPPILRDVPGNLETLSQFGRNEINLGTAKQQLRSNLEAANLTPFQKERMGSAIDEVSPILPKLSLGMMGGELKGVEWKGTSENGHVAVRLKERPEITDIHKVGDFGQEQFAKFAKTYDVDPNKFRDNLNFEFKRGSRTVLEGIWERMKAWMAYLEAVERYDLSLKGTKASTATEWLEDNAADLEDLLDEAGLWAPGSLPFRIVTELPQAMKDEIVARLRESFSQPYWDDIAETTLGNANTILEQGLQEGWSIRRIAEEMQDSLGGDDYAMRRGTLIARTECLVEDTEVHAANVVSVYRRSYQGPMFKIRTNAGIEFTGTPNHPMLTARGWVALCELKEGDYLLRQSTDSEIVRSSGNMDVEAPPTTIGQIFNSLAAVVVTERTHTAKPDFHGDGMDGYVDVLVPDSTLLYGILSETTKSAVDVVLSEACMRKRSLSTDCAGRPCFDVCDCASGGTVPEFNITIDEHPSNRHRSNTEVGGNVSRGLSTVVPLKNSVEGIAEVFGERSITTSKHQSARLFEGSSINASSFTSSENVIGTTPNHFSDFIATHTGLVELDEVVIVELFSNWSGHVYNLRTVEGYFIITGGLISHNSANALNAARVDVMDQVQNDLPEDVSKYIQKEWLSVLGTTTRPDHAALDGVPADEDGMWDLDGVMIPWPGHIDLPVGQRANCQCSVVTTFGMGDESAQELIQDYYDRQMTETEEASLQRLRVKGDVEGHPFRGNQWTEGQGDSASDDYKPKRESSYYGEAKGGVSQETHQFITDWQDSPTVSPTVSVIKELGKYVPKSSVMLYRGGAADSKAQYMSWTYDRGTAEGFVEPGEKVMKRSWYPNEILIDFTKLPQAYKDDLEANGMGNSLREVVCAYGTALKRMKEIRGNKSIKGDLPGHPFRGNQWAGGYGTGQTAATVLAEQLLGKHGGFTYSTVTQSEPLRGYAVSPYPERSFAKKASETTPDDIAKYIADNADLLRERNHYVGGWNDSESGKAFLDISIVDFDQSSAERIARDKDQIAIWDLSSKSLIEVNRNATSGGVAKGGYYRGRRAGENGSGRRSQIDF